MSKLDRERGDFMDSSDSYGHKQGNDRQQKWFQMSGVYMRSVKITDILDRKS